MRTPEPLPTIDEIRTDLAAAHIDHVGVTTADVLDDARRALYERRVRGLHGEMGFTFRNPDRSTDPRRAVAAAESVIVAARPYVTADDPPNPHTPGPHARIGRYAWVDHYAPLRTALRDVARRIKRAGERAVAFADDNAIVDRAVAHRAGLGWYGKNANLLLPGAGSFFALGCVITTAAYEPARRPAADGCGSCRQCIDDCPTGAIVAPGVIDARRCLSWVLQRPGPIPVEYRRAIADRIYGCDDCQDACPITVRLAARHTVELRGDERPAIDAVLLLDADDDWILERCGHWWIADRDLRWVRRNALVVLGNTASADDRRALDVVERYAAGSHPHGDALLAEHARWALVEIAERARVPAVT